MGFRKGREIISGGWENTDNWRKLKIGMSTIQVRKISGEPYEISVSSSTDRETWYYYPGHSKKVRFTYSSQKLESFNF